MKATVISAYDLVLCATNEGTIYRSNIAAARYAATLKDATLFWHNHIASVVVPCLTSRNGGYPGERLMFEGGTQAAVDALAAYYANHVAELDRDAIDCGSDARATGWEVHRDVYGYYPVGPGEEHSNGFNDAGENLGFDGRSHFADQLDAWRAAAERHKRGERSAACPI